MPRHFFPPEAFAAPYRTVLIDDLLTALMSKQLGSDWQIIREQQKSEDKKRPPIDRDLQRAIATCKKMILADLRAGCLVSHAYIENTGQFRRLTNRYWREELCGSALDGKLFDFDTTKCFSEFLQNSSVVVLDNYAIDWLTRKGIAESDRFFPEDLRCQLPAATRSPQTHYDWEAFEFYAAKRLHYQGGYVEIWRQRHLIAEMVQWCADIWDEEGIPDVKMLRKHVKIAHQRYLEENKGILRNLTRTPNGATLTVK